MNTHKRDWFHWSTCDCEESPKPIICRWWSVANEWWSLSWKAAEPPDSIEFVLMEEEEDIEEEEDTFHQLPELMKSWWSPMFFFCYHYVYTIYMLLVRWMMDLNLLCLLRLCFTWNDEEPHERGTYKFYQFIFLLSFVKFVVGFSLTIYQDIWLML